MAEPRAPSGHESSADHADLRGAHRSAAVPVARSAAATGSRSRTGPHALHGRKRRAACYVATPSTSIASRWPPRIPTVRSFAPSSSLRTFEGFGRLGILVVAGVYAPAGDAPVVRRLLPRASTPAFAASARRASRYRATQLNGSTRTVTSDLDLRASGRRAREIARATAALAHEQRPLRARALRRDSGRRARLPSDAALPQSDAASRLSTSQARRTSSSVVRKLPIASRST